MTGASSAVTTAFRKARAIFSDRIRRDGRLSPVTRILCLELVSRLRRANDVVYPSHEFLADTLGISYQAVKRAVAEIEKNNILEVEHRRVYQGQKNYYSAPAIATIMANQGEPGSSPSTTPTEVVTEVVTGPTTGIKTDPPRDQNAHFTGIKNDPRIIIRESSLNESGETQHQHHHRHQCDSTEGTGPKETAARVTNGLLELAGIKNTICAEPAFVRREYDLVMSWVIAGWDPIGMLRSAELQMARRRKSGLTEPVRTLGYFEPEFRKGAGRPSWRTTFSTGNEIANEVSLSDGGVSDNEAGADQLTRASGVPG
jgi:hypothetical protein